MRAFGWPLAILAILLLAAALHARFRPGGERSGDAQDYLLTAHSLAWSQAYGRHGVPEIGREPGYPLLLAGLMRTTALAGFRPECLATPGACPDALYRPAQVANLALALGAALLVGWIAWRLTGAGFAAAIATAYVALNAQMLSGRWEVLSDHLALFLLALVMALALRWLEAPGGWRAAAAGLALAALVMTKAVFLWLPLLALPVLAFAHRPRGAAVALAAAALPVGLWMLRNWWVAGEFALTHDRAGIALSSREVFNHMDLPQLACAFVYWTRGIGEDIAVQLFPPEVWRAFDLSDPHGFYMVSHERYGTWLAQAMAEQGLPLAGAREAVKAGLIGAFLERPLGWLASMPALVWRGLWVDEFVVLGFPALVAGTLWAARRGSAGWLLPFGLGWFNLLFYAAVSLNIPRYQITAVPALALATAWAGWRLAEAWRVRQSPLR